MRQGDILQLNDMSQLVSSTKPDQQLLRLIATARAAGLCVVKIVKRGRDVAIEVATQNDPEADDLESKIETMVKDAQ